MLLVLIERLFTWELLEDVLENLKNHANNQYVISNN